MFKSIRFLPLLVVAAWSRPTFAQDASPADPVEDDLELPAKPSTMPPSAAPSKPEPSPAHASSNPENRELEQELAALRARLDALEADRVSRARTSPPGTTNPEPVPVSTNLEKNAISRPVPTGLRIGGYVQTQYESNQLSESQLQQGGVPLNQDRFTLRRGRLRLDRGWEYANVTLELDANTTRGVNVGIRRAEGSLLYRGHNGEALPPLVMLSLGVTDLPFGFELLESSRVRPFMERSLGSAALFPTEMDIGAKLSGAISFLRYALAITNGEPVDDLPGRYFRDPNAAKDYSGRVGVETQPVKALSLAGGTSFYQGTGFHPGTSATKPSFTWIDSNEDRAIQASELQAIPGTAAQPSANFKRWAYALDFELVLTTVAGATRLYAEGFVASNLDRAYLIADPGLSGIDVREAGGYVALAQDVTNWAQIGLRASYYDPNADFAESVRGRQVPSSLAVRTFSALVALRYQDRARLSFQYDFVRDYLAKDAEGVPTDAKNNQWTLRLQVEL